MVSTYRVLAAEFDWASYEYQNDYKATKLVQVVTDGRPLRLTPDPRRPHPQFRRLKPETSLSTSSSFTDIVSGQVGKLLLVIVEAA